MIAMPLSVILPLAGFVVFASGLGVGMLAGYLIGKERR